MAESREQRLQADFEAIGQLNDGSTVFDYESTGEPPERYTLIFRGKGLARATTAGSEVEEIELHRCDIRLPYSYPERGPDIRWLTPIFHPNISFSGFINLKQIGLPWDKDITLDIVVERLWDVARFAFVNHSKAVNYTAKSWLEEESTYTLPLDNRPLRDKQKPSSSNIIRYQRREGSKIDLPTDNKKDDVLYIGDETSVPIAARQEMPDRRRAPVRENDDDDILYIS